MKPVSYSECRVYAPQYEGSDGSYAPKGKMQKDGHRLGDVVAGEEEASRIGKGDDTQGVQEEDSPNIVVLCILEEDLDLRRI